MKDGNQKGGNEMEEQAKNKINIIEDFWNDLENNKPYDALMGIPAGFTRHGLGEKSPDEAWFNIDKMHHAAEYFDEFDCVEKGEGFEVLGKDGVMVKYTWGVPVCLKYAPSINHIIREKFEIIA